MSNLPKVYFTKNITPENLIKLYEKLNKPLPGKVAFKIHSGEHDKPHIIQPEFMEPLLKKVNGTIVETNMGFPGDKCKRDTTEKHKKVLEKHGFTKISKWNILDSEGEMSIPISNGKDLKEDIVGKHLANYDSILVLSHFKGHIQGGFGGALKNIAIGLASPRGKRKIHGAETIPDLFKITDNGPFVARMAEACKGIIDYMKGNLVYLNVMKDISIDCDCVPNPKDPEIKDIGMLSSVDPIALDQACVDLIYNCPEPKKEELTKRIEEKKGKIILEYGEKLGLGSRKYELINID